MSAATRSQIFPLDTGALATSSPLLAVFHRRSMLMFWRITTRHLPASRTTPIHAEVSRSIDSPARSPSFIAASFSTIVAVEAGPRMRCVSVFRAAYRSSVTVAVWSVRPWPADHLVLSGLWFHSHSTLSAGVGERATPATGGTEDECWARDE